METTNVASTCTNGPINTLKITERFKVMLPSHELRDHCVNRARYHRERAGVKAAELPKLREVMEAIATGKTNVQTLAYATKFGHSNYHVSLDAEIDRLETDIMNHRNKSLLFEFYAEHLIDGTYILTKDDLEQVEIANRQV